jgi:hypothetical protein
LTPERFAKKWPLMLCSTTSPHRPCRCFPPPDSFADLRRGDAGIFQPARHDLRPRKQANLAVALWERARRGYLSRPSRTGSVVAHLLPKRTDDQSEPEDCHVTSSGSQPVLPCNRRRRWRPVQGPITPTMLSSRIKAPRL